MILYATSILFYSILVLLHRISSMHISIIIATHSYGVKTRGWKERPRETKMDEMSEGFFQMGSKSSLRKSEVDLCANQKRSQKYAVKKQGRQQYLL